MVHTCTCDCVCACVCVSQVCGAPGMMEAISGNKAKDFTQVHTHIHIQILASSVRMHDVRLHNVPLVGGDSVCVYVCVCVCVYVCMCVQGELTGALKALGYSAHDVYKF